MGQTDITGSGLMIAEELRVLFDEIRADLVTLRADITLINHDMLEIRKQLDRIEMLSMPQPESIGIAPNTPPPDFIPPEMM